MTEIQSSKRRFGAAAAFRSFVLGALGFVDVPAEAGLDFVDIGVRQEPKDYADLFRM